MVREREREKVKGWAKYKIKREEAPRDGQSWRKREEAPRDGQSRRKRERERAHRDGNFQESTR